MSTVHIGVLAVCMWLSPGFGVSPLATVIGFMVGCFILNLLTGKHVPK